MNGYDQNSCRDSVAKTLKLVYFVRASRLFSLVQRLFSQLDSIYGTNAGAMR